MKNFHALRVLEDANFRNLWLSQLISQTFLNTLVFSQLLRVYELTKSNIAVSGLVLMIGIPNLVLGAVAGVLVDRWDKKIVMIACQVIRVVAVLGFVLSPESVFWIYALMFVIASVTQFWSPAEVSTIPKIIKGPLLLPANSIFTLTFFSTVILGNILAGPALAFFGARTTYFVISLGFLVSSAFLIRLPGQDVREMIRVNFLDSKNLMKSLMDDSVTRRLKEDFVEGVQFIQKNPIIMQAIVFLAASQTLIASLSVIAPGFADKVIGLPATDVSLLIMLPAALGMVVGAVAVGQFFLAANKERLIKFGLLASGVTLILIAQTRFLSHLVHFPVAILGFLLLMILGAGNAFLDVPANTILQEKSTEEIRSRIYGVLTAIVGAAAVFPIVIVGTLSDFIGVEKVLMLLGLAVLALTFINRRLFRPVKIVPSS